MQQNIWRISLLCLSIIACKPSTNKTTSKPTPSVKLETVATQSDTYILQLSGNIDGKQTVKLGFMVAGKIDQFPVNEGDLVTKGKTLAKLEQNQYQIAVNLASLQVKQLEDEYNRLNKMRQKDALSASDFEKISIGLLQAKEQLKLQQINLDHTILKSPINGMIVKKLNQTGEIVAQGYPVVVVSDIRKVNVLAYVPEQDLQYIKIGQKTEVNIQALGKIYTGIIQEVGGMAEATTRSFTIKVEVDNPDYSIRPGMIAQVTIPTNQERIIIGVPTQSVLRDIDGKTYVYLFDETKKTVFKRFVTLGNVLGKQIEITNGLIEGDKVVSSGQNRLSEGIEVVIFQ